MNETFDRKAHWQRVHLSKAPDQVSWFQASPMCSIELIDRCAPRLDARIIDVGAGISRLVDSLIERGRTNLTVLDVSEQALAHTRARLGEAAGAVRWIHEDLLHADLSGPYDLWHDRAVFHFLTDPADRARYVDQLLANLAPGGHAVIATFALDGPETCSGLPVARYSAPTLHQTLGTDRFALVDARRNVHVTPQGKEQRFQFGVFRREPVS